MKNSKLMLSTAVAVCAMLGVGAASAADLAVKAMPYAAPMPVFSWTGFYVGGNIGGGWSDTNLTNTVSDGAIAWPDLAPGQGIGYNNNNGVVGGGQIGVNFQSNNWVYGLELLVSAADMKATVRNPYVGPPFSAGDDVFSTKINTLLLATARIGYAWDRSLLYVKGGYAGANVHISVSDNVCPGNPINCGAGSDSNWRSGFTVGAGVEYAVTNNWIVGVEYDFARLGSASVNLGDANARYVFNDAERNLNMVLGRVSYKFGWN
jgi:outer membrane immunogenic protein